MLEWWRNRRRARVRKRPFPAEWQSILTTNVPYCSRLTAAELTELQGHIQVFLNEKTFVGQGGLEIDDEIRVTVAAQACLLLLNRDTRYYPYLSTIVMYPSAYKATTRRQDPATGAVIEEEVVRLGESWLRGQVVLAWDASLHGASDITDGKNLVLHEFAHQLDQKDGHSDGAPILEHASHYVAWARVLSEEYLALAEDVAEDQATFLDRYGATNAAEFFAVATEFFFERPAKFETLHRELYAELKGFYRQDPIARYRADRPQPARVSPAERRRRRRALRRRHKRTGKGTR